MGEPTWTVKATAVFAGTGVTVASVAVTAVTRYLVVPLLMNVPTSLAKKFAVGEWILPETTVASVTIRVVDWVPSGSVIDRSFWFARVGAELRAGCVVRDRRNVARDSGDGRTVRDALTGNHVADVTRNRRGVQRTREVRRRRGQLVRATRDRGVLHVTRTAVVDQERGVQRRQVPGRGRARRRRRNTQGCELGADERSDLGAGRDTRTAGDHTSDVTRLERVRRARYRAQPGSSGRPWSSHWRSSPGYAHRP